METLSYRIVLRSVKVLNVILMAVLMIFCWQGNYAGGVQSSDMARNMTGLVALIFIFLYMTYGRIYDSFLVSLFRISEMIYSQWLALLMADTLMYIILSLVTQQLVRFLPIVITLIMQMGVSVLWCVAAHTWYFKKFSPRKTLVVYDRKQNVENLIHAYELRKKFDVQQTIEVDSCIGEQFQSLREIETVFLCGVHSHERNIVLKYCVEHNIVVYVLPRIGDVIMSSAKRMHLFHLPFLRVGPYDPSPEYLFIKRCFDIVLSVLALLVLSPIMLVTAIAIKLSDGGSVFYKQKRLTKDRKEFYVYKFRSMRQDAEKDGVARLSTGEKDPRITPVGRFIRKVRIDELPQLINILQGNMSIVGPRPERPEIAEQYEKELPEFSLRLQAKAGLTGYAQVYGKYNTTPYDKLQMDLMYIGHPSFLEDMRIIFATIKILFIPESTEGVAEGWETAMARQERKSDEVEI